MSTPSPSPALPVPGLVVLISRTRVDSEVTLCQDIEKALTAKGYQVFADRAEAHSLEWAADIDRRIRTAEAAVAVVSPSSGVNEMLSLELELARNAAEHQHGRPKLIVVRIGTPEALPEELSHLVEGPSVLTWNSPADTVEVLGGILSGVAQPPPAPTPAPIPISPGPGQPKPTLRLATRPLPKPRIISAVPVAPKPVTPKQLVFEPDGGAVPLDSDFYVHRTVDTELRNALLRNDSIVLIKGARQMGKTSLLARGVQLARERSSKVVLTDFQKLNQSHLNSPDSLYFTLAESIAEQLGLETFPQDVWDERRGANVNFERYLRRAVLAKLNAPLMWALDEVDRLFLCHFGSEVFGLFRSWHNERALDPSGPWAGLTLCIAYATEAHLFITDMNQSPFNVGTRLALEDFTTDQVADLNRRYGTPLKSDDEAARFYSLVNGQPYLVRRGLREMAEHHHNLAFLEELAHRDEGIFGDHLRRILISLARDPSLCDEMREILRGRPCPSPEGFYRLRSAGVINGTSQRDCRPRCEIYKAYLTRHLLS